MTGTSGSRERDVRRRVGGLLMVLWAALLPLAALASEAAPHVLMINSYHPGYAWSDDIAAGLAEGLADREVDLSVEYLDTRRFPGPDLRADMVGILDRKYHRYPADVVVVSDNAAFDFAMAHRDRLFPDTPIVFTGYNNFDPALLAGVDGVTGVNERLDYDAAIDTALAIHPDTETLVFILSTGEASSARIADIVEATVLPAYRGRFDIVVLKDAPMADIRATLAALPPKSLVFLMGQTSDSGPGRPYTPIENGEMIAAASPVPVYTLWDFHIGTGVVGGRILTGIDQGRAAADKVARILDGTAADAIPPLMTSPARLVFDHRAMIRHDIDRADLPAQAHIRFRQETLWDRYRWQILAVVAVILVEALLILALLRAMGQRRRALETLEDERADLENRVNERTRDLAEALRTRDTILDNALVTIALLRDRRFVWVNDHMVTMFGYDRDEIIGRPIGFLYADPADDRRVAEESPAILARGESYRRAFRYRRKDGGVLWCSVSGRAVDPGDPAKGALFVVADITAQKETEQALAASNLELEQFAYAASHDLQEPLRMITLYIQLLDRRLGDRLDDEERTFLDFATDGARRMNRLIHDLLDYSRITTRATTPGPVDSRACLDEALANLAPAIAEGDATIDIDSLPTVLADPGQITRLFQNLVGNALKYRHPDRPPRLAITAERQGQRWAFAVADNGVGITPENRERVFGVFQRLHDRSDASGTGIGLALCRRIVEHHGGALWVEGDPDQGSIFRFTLPAA